MENEFIRDEKFAETSSPSISGNNEKASRLVVYKDVVEKALQELSPSQLAAATTEGNNVLLLAPAGTGKTRTLTTRYLRLLADGVPPEEILLSTFSNGAAAELQERIQPATPMKMEELWIGTTHSIALRIIRAQAKQIGYSNVETIIDRDQQEEIVKRVMRDIDHPMASTPNETNTIKRVLEFIEVAKNRLTSPSDARADFENRDFNWGGSAGIDDIAAYDAYERYKQSYDMIDYNDMLYLATTLLESDPEVAKIWQSTFSHIMVDEYQDLSGSQIRMLRNLVVPGKTSFYAAADDDQSIYGWRGSDLQATLSFKRYWPNAEIVHLEENYRTPKSIFDHASSLISHNNQRHAKMIKTRPDNNAFVRTIQKFDPAAEKEAVFENIMEGSRKMDVPLERMAILCRSNRECQEYASYFASRGVEVNLHESIRLDAAPIRALTSWMQVSTAADNPLLFEQIAGYPEKMASESFSLNLMALLARRKREDEKLGPIEMITSDRAEGKRKYVQDGTDGARIADKIVDVRKFIDDMTDGGKKKPESPFAKLSEYLGIGDMAAKSDKAEDHQIGQFMRLADDMVRQIGLPKTLASLTQLDFNAGRAGINIATMHGAKGLEYDIVALPGWSDGDFPNYRRQTDKEVEEERRLAYVAITRAKKLLVISWSGSKNRQARPSRFIKEAGLL